MWGQCSPSMSSWSWTNGVHRLNMKADSSRQARQHFEQHFGRTNRHISVANHTFVFLDAPLLVEEDYSRAGLSKSYEHWRADEHGTVEFIRSFQRTLGGESFSTLPYHSRLTSSRGSATAGDSTHAHTFGSPRRCFMRCSEGARQHTERGWSRISEYVRQAHYAIHI